MTGEATVYALEMTDKQWEELESLSSGLIDLAPGELTRRQWYALGLMSLGKAQQIEDGAYGNDEKWADEMRDLAGIIFAEFQPGDGKL